MASKKSISGEPIKLSRVRLSFPQLHKAVTNKAFPDSPPAFGASFLLDPTDAGHRDTIKKINAEIIRLQKEAWGLEGKPHPKQDPKPGDAKFPFGKGEVKVNDAGEVYSGYEGMYFVSARAREQNPPRTLNANRQDLKDPKEIEKLFYGGCYVTASVNFWVQDNPAGKAIRCGLRGVQFIADGEAFGGGHASDAEFDEIEETEGLDGLDDDLGV